MQDNLSNSVAACLKRVHKITGKPEAVTFHQADLRDAAALAALFAATKFDGVIHFAAFKARTAGRVQAPARAAGTLRRRRHSVGDQRSRNPSAAARLWVSLVPSRCTTTTTTWWA